ncbi:hypothetical protein [Clostridium baratii]|uniref:hypothetical protein n=1 Tax=Clostridium baratii TaxID=1561 RepID=UPI0022E16F87|nr:hypothetical protein [Clostridium baratii]
MSKKRHKNRENEYENGQDQFNNFSGNPFANNPFGIDPNQLMSMLGNVDKDKLNNIMESMSKDGVDLNSFMAQNGMNPGNNGMNNNGGNGNPNPNHNPNPNPNPNNMNPNPNNMNPMDMFNNMGMNNNMGPMGAMNPMAILSQLTQMGNFNNQNNRNNGNKKNTKKNKYNTGDANMDMLLALRNAVDSDRIEFVDKIIGMYKKGDLD